MINLIGGYTPGFFFPFASVYTPVYPCVLDGSLSFLEMVWKILKDLNKTIIAVNNNHTDIINLAAEIDRIEAALNQKLSYLEVNFDFLTLPVTADKTFDECIEAFNKGLIIGRGQMGRGELCFFAAIKKDDDTEIRFYALTSHNTLAEIVYTAEGVTVHAHTNITTEGGTITGELNVPAPTQNNNAATKKYVDDQDAATLVSAKNYADSHDATTLQSAKDYADSHDATTLQSAKDYADAQDVINLAAAKAYAEQFKTLRGVITYEDSSYKCNQTFATLYGRATSGLDVELVYSDPVVEFKFDVLHLEIYQPTAITFKNSNYTCTISSSDVVTFS